MVVNSDPVSDGRVRREAQALAAAGHELTVYGVRWKGSEGRDDALGFAVVRPAMPAWTAEGGAVNLMRKTARWYVRMKPLVDAALAVVPDALHAHDLDTIGPASQAALARGVPCVYDDHEASYVDKLPNYVPAELRGAKRVALDAMTRNLQRRGEALEREVRTRKLAAMITVSESLADRLVARFGGPRPVVVRNLPLLRDVPRTNALRERLGLAAGVKVLVHHGTVTEGSGLETAIRALRDLGGNFVLAVVGRVWRAERYEDLARAEAVAERLRFVPFVPEDEMFRLVASADVSVVPTEPNSVGNEFGIPNKLFESMMAGVSIVASDVPEVASVLARTGAGATFPARSPQDPAAFAAAVRRVLDPAVWQTCRAAGLAAARGEFHWERESRKLVALYEGIA